MFVEYLTLVQAFAGYLLIRVGFVYLYINC